MFHFHFDMKKKLADGCACGHPHRLTTKYRRSGYRYRGYSTIVISVLCTGICAPHEATSRKAS